MKNQEKVMVILGWWFGMGALIQSTVNAIWLSKKLGFRPLIHWGRSCPYNTGNGEDVYSQYFCSPDIFSQWDFRIKPQVTFPEVFRNQIPPEQSIYEIDRLARGIDTYGTHWWRREDREKLLMAEGAVVYQYLTSHLAWEMVYGLEAPMNCEEFNWERELIYDEYFQPQEPLKKLAEKFWNENFTNQEKVLGMHIRGSDKIIEGGLPSVQKYIKTFNAENSKFHFKGIFLATDSVKAEKEIKSKLGSNYAVKCQNYPRSDGVQGIHSKSGGAFENGKDMIVDIEILSRCQTVVAFRGSQISWWLEQKRSQMGFDFIPIEADLVDWIRSGIKVFLHRDFKSFITFLREANKRLSK